MSGDNYSLFSRDAHSLSLKPTSTKPPPTKIGRFTSIPSDARSFSISSSLMSGSLFLSSMDFYSRPLVLKNLFSGSPLSLCHAASSS